MNAIDRRTTARILKVNHAGEYGAIRIYRAQAGVARKLYPDVVDFLQETLQHEIRHCFLFLDAMRERSAKPCRVMPLWGNGGLVLGFVTALLGRKGIWICTAAVEAAVGIWTISSSICVAATLSFTLSSIPFSAKS